VADVVTGKGGDNTALPIFPILNFLLIPSPPGEGNAARRLLLFSNRRDAWVRVLLCSFFYEANTIA
jgi:hypothetical protein